MTLPSSGSLSLSQIQGEFGGSNPISLSEYYAGGTYVPAGTTGTYGAVPSSGAISIRNFYGTSNAIITISNQSIGVPSFDPAYAYYFLTAGGQVQSSIDPGGINPTTLEQWCTPTSQAGNFEARVTEQSGSLSGGSGINTWLALSSTRNWYVQEMTSGNITACTFLVEIRRTGTTTVLDSATITLTAQVY